MSPMASHAPARSQNVPGGDWKSVETPEAFGLTLAVRASVDAALDALPATSFMAVASGEILYRYGDIAEVSYLASTRKSILPC